MTRHIRPKPLVWQEIGEYPPHLPVLVSRPTDRVRYTPTTAFHDATGVWRLFRSEGGRKPLPFVPTHWMPLPDVPDPTYVRDYKCDPFLEMLAAIEARAEHAERRLRHTTQWNAERWERITAYAKEKGFWPDIACIWANGTLTGLVDVNGDFIYDPPTYAQQLNIAIHRAEAAEKRASELQGKLDIVTAATGEGA